MRVLVQEVKSASVTIEGETVASIGHGMLLFVGFTEGDNEATLCKMRDKVLKLRIFPDENGKTNLSLDAVHGEVLSVSQFTLYGDVKEGNRPSFVNAMKPEEASRLYALWVNLLREKIPSVQSGRFQTTMEVALVNDGPFTLWLDSNELFPRKVA
jgi:D-tyrosyl-tRNA(Tyr) deacylase